MAHPDLHLVDSREHPRVNPLQVESYTFVRSDKALLIYRDGRLVDYQTACDALHALLQEGIDKFIASVNEALSTPRGLL